MAGNPTPEDAWWAAAEADYAAREDRPYRRAREDPAEWRAYFREFRGRSMPSSSEDAAAAWRIAGPDVHDPREVLAMAMTGHGITAEDLIAEERGILVRELDAENSAARAADALRELETTRADPARMTAARLDVLAAEAELRAARIESRLERDVDRYADVAENAEYRVLRRGGIPLWTPFHHPVPLTGQETVEHIGAMRTERERATRIREAADQARSTPPDAYSPEAWARFDILTTDALEDYVVLTGEATRRAAESETAAREAAHSAQAAVLENPEDTDAAEFAAMMHRQVNEEMTRYRRAAIEAANARTAYEDRKNDEEQAVENAAIAAELHDLDGMPADALAPGPGGNEEATGEVRSRTELLGRLAGGLRAVEDRRRESAGRGEPEQQENPARGRRAAVEEAREMALYWEEKFAAAQNELRTMIEAQAGSQAEQDAIAGRMESFRQYWGDWEETRADREAGLFEGTAVEYHGSKSGLHGRYVIRHADRGQFVLESANDPDAVLRRVRRASLTAAELPEAEGGQARQAEERDRHGAPDRGQDAGLPGGPGSGPGNSPEQRWWDEAEAARSQRQPAREGAGDADGVLLGAARHDPAEWRAYFREFHGSSMPLNAEEAARAARWETVREQRGDQRGAFSPANSDDDLFIEMRNSTRDELQAIRHAGEAERDLHDLEASGADPDRLTAARLTAMASVTERDAARVEADIERDQRAAFDVRDAAVYSASRPGYQSAGVWVHEPLDRNEIASAEALAREQRERAAGYREASQALVGGETSAEPVLDEGTLADLGGFTRARESYGPGAGPAEREMHDVHAAWRQQEMSDPQYLADIRAESEAEAAWIANHDGGHSLTSDQRVMLREMEEREEAARQDAEAEEPAWWGDPMGTEADLEGLRHGLADAVERGDRELEADIIESTRRFVAEVELPEETVDGVIRYAEQFRGAGAEPQRRLREAGTGQEAAADAPRETFGWGGGPYPDMAAYAQAELEAERNAADGYHDELWAATKADLEAEDRAQAEEAGYLAWVRDLGLEANDATRDEYFEVLAADEADAREQNTQLHREWLAEMALEAEYEPGSYGAQMAEKAAAEQAEADWRAEQEAAELEDMAESDRILREMDAEAEAGRIAEQAEREGLTPYEEIPEITHANTALIRRRAAELEAGVDPREATSWPEMKGRETDPSWNEFVTRQAAYYETQLEGVPDPEAGPGGDLPPARPQAGPGGSPGRDRQDNDPGERDERGAGQQPVKGFPVGVYETPASGTPEPGESREQAPPADTEAAGKAAAGDGSAPDGKKESSVFQRAADAAKAAREAVTARREARHPAGRGKRARDRKRDRGAELTR